MGMTVVSRKAEISSTDHGPERIVIPLESTMPALSDGLAREGHRTRGGSRICPSSGPMAS